MGYSYGVMHDRSPQDRRAGESFGAGELGGRWCGGGGKAMGTEGGGEKRRIEVVGEEGRRTGVRMGWGWSEEWTGDRKSRGGSNKREEIRFFTRCANGRRRRLGRGSGGGKEGESHRRATSTTTRKILFVGSTATMWVQ